MNVLQTISVEPFHPARLQGLKFSDFFKWMSISMTTVSSLDEGDTVRLPNSDNWMAGFKI